jgi:hypothetical protein
VAVGAKDSASTAVTDAYASLRALATRRLSRRPRGELVLTGHAEDPETWGKPLATELTAAEAATDHELIAAAQALLSLTDEVGSRSGKYRVKVQDSQGVYIGDHGSQVNYFNK